MRARACQVISVSASKRLKHKTYYTPFDFDFFCEKNAVELVYRRKKKKKMREMILIRGGAVTVTFCAG